MTVHGAEDGTSLEGPPVAKDLVGLPKAELHVHLEGSFSRSRVVELARAAGERDVDRRVARAFAYRDLASFLEALDWWCSLVQSETQAEEQAWQFSRFLAKQGVCYAEVTVNPTHWTGLPRRVLLEAMDAGFGRAHAEGLADARIVVSLRRDQPDEEVCEVLAELGDDRPDRIVGLGVDGDEAAAARLGLGGRKAFAEAFAEARRIGLGCTAHAGESSGPAGVSAALDELGVTRIDHGVRSVEDPALLRRLRDEGIVLDVCPTSNVRLLYGSMDRHPLAQLDGAGVRLTIGTDDPMTFATTLADELALAAARCGWDLARLARCQGDALDASFCDPPTRAALAEHLAASWPGLSTRAAMQPGHQAGAPQVVGHQAGARQTGAHQAVGSQAGAHEARAHQPSASTAVGLDPTGDRGR